MKTPEEIQALASKFCAEEKCYSYWDYCGYRCLIHKFAKSISRVMSDEEILESARKYIKSMSDFYEYTPMMRFAHSLCAYGEKLNNLQSIRIGKSLVNYGSVVKNTTIQAYVEFLAIPMGTASLIDSIQRYPKLLRRKENSSADPCNPF